MKTDEYDGGVLEDQGWGRELISISGREIPSILHHPSFASLRGSIFTARKPFTKIHLSSDGAGKNER